MKRYCYLSVLIVVMSCMLPLSLLANGDTFPPVVGNIPDIFIGSEEDNVSMGATIDLGFFQFPNALNLDDYVCDIDTVTSKIRWSFYEDPGAPDGAIDNFEINDKRQLAGPEDAVLPGVKEITGVAFPDTRDPVISIWDIKACPAKDVVTSYNTSIQDLSNIMVTFYASDGTKVDSKSIQIMSLPNRSWDNLKPPPPFGYVFPFDDPDGEGWEPFHMPAGTFVPDPLGGYYIAPTVTSPSEIGIEDTQGQDVYGSWGMKYDAHMDYEKDYLYKAKYTLRTDQSDPLKSPQIRMRWSDFASLVLSGHFIDKGANGVIDVPTPYSSYYFQPTTEGRMCRNLKLYLDLIDFTPEQEGLVFCDQIEVSRFAPPLGGSQVLIYDSPADFDKWTYFSAPAFDRVTSGVSTTGLWLESPAAMGATSLYYGGWGTHPDKVVTDFEENKLYKAIFTLRCDSDDARKNLPMIRVRISNGAFDWTAYRNVRQVPGSCGQMPYPGGREYPLFIESPPHIVKTGKAYGPNAIVLNFDIVDGGVGEYGRVYLDKVVVESYPMP